MSDDSADADVNLPVTQDEALVLFEWLGNFNKREDEFEDHAEQRVLWALEAMLESQLVEPFSPDYRDLVAAARERVRDSTE
jgi:hypothetical protein